MRKIEIYEMQTNYVLDDSQNIIALNKKLENDVQLLKQIENDYCVDPKQYKSEFIAAKINYLKNEYLYYWLYLKKFFGDALNNQITSLPDLHKEEMKNNGWMFPQSFINKRVATSGAVEITTEELYIKTFDSLFDKLFGFDIGEKCSRINRYYQQAIINYKSYCYYSCAVSLFPIIESYHQFMTHFNEDKFYRIKENLDSIAEKMENVHQIYTVKITYYIDLVKQFNNLAKNHYFSTSLDRTVEPQIINRNRIMHGIFSREISQKDCLQLFCVISNMVVIKSIIDANEMLNKVSEELRHLLADNH